MLLMLQAHIEPVRMKALIEHSSLCKHGVVPTETLHKHGHDESGHEYRRSHLWTLARIHAICFYATSKTCKTVHVVDALGSFPARQEHQDFSLQRAELANASYVVRSHND